MGPTETTRRLFVAVRPTPPVTRALAALADELADAVGPAVLWSPPDGYHVTLRYIGEAPVEPVVAALDRALPSGEVTIELGPGLIELGSAIVAPATGADELAHLVRRAVGGLGPRQPERAFVGHLTIGRWRRGQSTGALIGRAVGGRFTTGSVELLASARQPADERCGDGQESSYETIRAWSAQGP